MIGRTLHIVSFQAGKRYYVVDQPSPGIDENYMDARSRVKKSLQGKRATSENMGSNQARVHSRHGNPEKRRYCPPQESTCPPPQTLSRTETAGSNWPISRFRLSVVVIIELLDCLSIFCVFKRDR